MNPSHFPVTTGFIVVSIAVYGLMNLWDYEAVFQPLLITEYIKPVLPEIREGQLWRLFSPMFLHFSIFHIAFNLLWVWQLGRLVEFKQGGIVLGLLCLLSGAIANIAQYFVTGPLFGGMSGVVYALFGYVWLQGLTNRQFGIQLPNNIVYLLLGWFVICWSGILEKLFGLGIANTAHTAGLASGIVLSLLVSALSRWLPITRR